MLTGHHARCVYFGRHSSKMPSLGTFGKTGLTKFRCVRFAFICPHCLFVVEGWNLTCSNSQLNPIIYSILKIEWSVTVSSDIRLEALALIFSKGVTDFLTFSILLWLLGVLIKTNYYWSHLPATKIELKNYFKNPDFHILNIWHLWVQKFVAL